MVHVLEVFFFKQKTAYEMRISDWSSDVCSSDLIGRCFGRIEIAPALEGPAGARSDAHELIAEGDGAARDAVGGSDLLQADDALADLDQAADDPEHRAAADHCGGALRPAAGDMARHRRLAAGTREIGRATV